METDTVVADIAARLARLEKSNRRLRLTLGAVVVAASSFALVAAGRQDSKPTSEALSARAFIVVGADGRKLGHFGETMAGVSLTMTDKDNPTGAACELAMKLGKAVLRMESDESRLNIGVEGERAKNNFDAALKRAPEENPPAVLVRMERKERASVWRLAFSGESYFNFWNGRAGSVFGAQADGGGYLRIADGERTRLALGPTSILTPRTGATESRPVSSIVLFGPDGTVIEKLPR